MAGERRTVMERDAGSDEKRWKKFEEEEEKQLKGGRELVCGREKRREREGKKNGEQLSCFFPEEISDVSAGDTS